ncbi:hypothetical protein ACVWXX_000119 [Bacillus toyonensis]
MPFVWITNHHSTLFFYYVSNAAITSYEKSKHLICLFNRLQQNERKSHRYEKKIVFDILDVVYNCHMSENQAV